MRSSILERYARFVFAHRVAVLLSCAAVTLLAAAACLRLELHTSREDLAAGKTVAGQAYDDIIAEFGPPNELLIVVEAADEAQRPAPEVYQAFVHDVGDQLASRTDFIQEVFRGIDLDEVQRFALHFLPSEELLRIVEEVTAPGSPLRRLRGVGGLADLNSRLAETIEEGLSSAGAEARAGAAAGVQGLARAVQWEADFLARPRETADALDMRDILRDLAASGRALSAEGYLTTRDGDAYFLVARPTSSSSDLSYVNPLIATVNGILRSVEERHPGLRAGLTGLPAMVQEEMAAVRSDTIFTTSVAVLGIIILAMLAFHQPRLAPLVLLVLAMGVTWAGALIALSIGYLNLITSSFAAILVGLGIDFGVHIVSQYEIETAGGRECADAIATAVRKTGPGLFAGSATTAAAFFAMTQMDFPGFQQLGFVGGFGILLCLTATFLALPALLAVDGARRRRAGKPARSARSARLRRGDRVSRAVLRFPWAVLAGAVLLSVWLGGRAVEVEFDENIQNLLPFDAESLRLQERVRSESDLSPDFLMVMTGDREELARLESANPNAPTIARRESILDYIPPDEEARAELLRRLAGELRRIELVRGRPSSRTALLDSLTALEDAFAGVEEVAFSTGDVPLLEATEAAMNAVNNAREQIETAPPEKESEWAEGEARLMDLATDWRAQLLEMAQSPPPKPSDLPEALRRRLIGPSGKYLLYLYPDAKLSEPAVVEAFIRDAKLISPTATGYPILVEEGTDKITRGFDRVLWLGVLLSMTALLIDFRHVGFAIAAAVTTGLGLLWMLGFMGVGGLQFNLANLPAVPLVLGAGVAYGIHVLHRYRQEGKEGLPTVLHHTGRAILISALTTMIGFGSLGLASHRGVAALGRILLFGIGSCFVAATIVLPCVLEIVSRRRGRAS